MDGPRGGGGGGDSRGGSGSWRTGSYDATKQIKEFLGVPTDDVGKPVVDAEPRTPPQNIPRHRQSQHQHLNEQADRSDSPSGKHQRWEGYRYQDGRYADNYGSPGRSNFRLGNYDHSRTPPNRYHDVRQRTETYGSPNRNNPRSGSYDRGYGGSPGNQYQFQHQRTGGKKDLKDVRSNGPHSDIGSPLIVGCDVESPEFRPSPEVLAELEEQFLFPLKKKSIRFPKAKYFCRLCDYHCDSLDVCRRHISDNRHKKLKEAKNLDTTLKNLPAPNDIHVDVIDKLIRSVAEEMLVTPEMTEARREVVRQLNNQLMEKVKGYSLEMVGSSLSGFCLKSSNINVDVVMEENLSASTALLAVKELVGKSDMYRDVLDDLSSTFPTISFTHHKTSLRIVVGAGSVSSKLTNQLLADYASMDPRVPVLGVAFRYWAQLCQIDDQSRGTLPAHVFPIMVVHFLQQHRPAVLPVLHKLHPNPDGDVYLRPGEVKDKWVCKNTESIGQLWLKLFRFYTIGFKTSECVINVRQLQPMTRAEKTWSKKVAVEDPFQQKRNLTRTVSGSAVFEYIVERFKATYKYFAIPQLPFGPAFHHVAVKEAQTAVNGSKASSSCALKSKKGDMLLESIEKAGHSPSEGSSEAETEKNEEDVDVAMEGEEFEDDEDGGDLSGLEADTSSITLDDSVTETKENRSPNGVESGKEETSKVNLDDMTSPILLVSPSLATKLIIQVQAHHLTFKFEGKVFTGGQKPPLICGSCQKEGHSKAECREDELPPLTPLPRMHNQFLDKLTVIFEHLTDDFEPSQEEIEERDRIVYDLESYIRMFFNGAKLELFGSSANGFGFQRSDLDICLTFEGNPSGQDLDHIAVIESLADKLKRYRHCGHVFAITTAKVPIVKFSIRRACLEADLSLYNTLALQNTKLLYTYAKIDHRVKCLGYAMKFFAKLCDIGDASRGSLSSYAYILMVIHFLQQCKPPVVPVLQELFDASKPAPELIIDSWNAWFYDDIKSLPKAWKDHGKNRDSVGQLWVSMLRYYTETFNWKEHVVTIRQQLPLTRLQKLWNSRCIAIEDPFDLSHNLGAGLSRKMNTFIMKAFIRGREIFGRPITTNPPGYRDLVDYLFDVKHLTDGAPPNDRGCRCCGKIGHIQKDCPKKKYILERREKEKKERQMNRRDMKRDEDKLEGELQKSIQNSPERDKQQHQSGGTVETATTKTERQPASKSAEGISTFFIPFHMMDDHISRWESDKEYREFGEKKVGMARYLVEVFDSSEFDEETVICQRSVPLLDEKYVWTVNWNKGVQCINEMEGLPSDSLYSLYHFIIDTLEKCKNRKQKTKMCTNDLDIPPNVGQTLMSKIKEADDRRKEKLKKKKKLRLRSEAEKKKAQAVDKAAKDKAKKGKTKTVYPENNKVRKISASSQPESGLPDITKSMTVGSKASLSAAPDSSQVTSNSDNSKNPAQNASGKKGKQRNRPDKGTVSNKQQTRPKLDKNKQASAGDLTANSGVSKGGATKLVQLTSQNSVQGRVATGPEKQNTVLLKHNQSQCDLNDPHKSQQKSANLTDGNQGRDVRRHLLMEGLGCSESLSVTISTCDPDVRIVTSTDGTLGTGDRSNKKKRKQRQKKKEKKQ